MKILLLKTVIFARHRVTPVLPGATPRINIIFTYEKEVGAMGSDYVLRKFFGRTAEKQRAMLDGASAAPRL